MDAETLAYLRTLQEKDKRFKESRKQWYESNKEEILRKKREKYHEEVRKRQEIAEQGGSPPPTYYQRRIAQLRADPEYVPPTRPRGRPRKVVADPPS